MVARVWRNRGRSRARPVREDRHYFIEYPEDIQLLGLSFNTVLGASGWALQGEYSLRRDAPLQRAERTVLEDGLAPNRSEDAADRISAHRAATNIPRQDHPRLSGALQAE